jgi:hypothetical protein
MELHFINSFRAAGDISPEFLEQCDRVLRENADLLQSYLESRLGLETLRLKIENAALSGRIEDAIFGIADYANRYFNGELDDKIGELSFQWLQICRWQRGGFADETTISSAVCRLQNNILTSIKEF